MKKSIALALILSRFLVQSNGQADPNYYYQNAQKALKKQDFYHALLYLYAFQQAAPPALADKAFKKEFDERFSRLELIVKERVENYESTSNALSQCKEDLQNANNKSGYATVSSGLHMSNPVDTLPAIPLPPQIRTYPLVIKGGANIKIDFYYSSTAFDKPHLIIQFPAKWTGNTGKNLENLQAMPAGSAAWLDRGIRDSEPSCILIPVDMKDIRFTSVSANPQDNYQFSMFIYKGKFEFLNALTDPKKHLVFNVFNNGRGYFVCLNTTP